MLGEPALRRDTVSETSGIELIACGLARHQRGYVSDGLRLRARCLFVDSFADLDRALGTVPQCDALVLGMKDPLGRDALGTVERISRGWTSTAIVILCAPRLDTSTSIRSLALAGAHQFVFEGVNDTASSLARAIENARRECTADGVLVRLLPLIPAALHSMVHAIVAQPDTLTTVADVAIPLGVHRKTLVNRCARSGFVQPAEVVLWCRLAVVAHFLERTGATVESIAMTLGFPSHTALRNLIKRYTGHRATEIRANGGLTIVLAAFRNRLAS